MKQSLLALNLLAAASLALLAGCGPSEPDAPGLRSDARTAASVFDTVEVKLNVAVNDLVDGTNITIVPDNVHWALSDDKSTVKIWGDSIYLGQTSGGVRFPMFEENTAYTVTLHGLVSKEGKAQGEDLEVRFDTYPMIDHDFVGDSVFNDLYTSADSLFGGGKFVDASSFGIAQRFSGMLAGDFLGSVSTDIRDFYSLDLTRDQDSLLIRLESAQASKLTLTFIGPIPATGSVPLADWESDVADNASAVDAQQLNVVIDFSERHSIGLGNDARLGDPARYFVVVAYKNTGLTTDPIPYVLNISGGNAL